MIRPAILCLCLLLSFLTTTTRAQGSLDATIADLQKQISIRDRVDRDNKTPADLRALNRRVLEAKRRELAEAVRLRIAQLQRYLATAGVSLTREERQSAETSLRYLISIRDGVPVGPRPAAAQALSQTENAPVRPRSVGEGLARSKAESRVEMPVTRQATESESGLRFDALREGDTVIRGWSAPGVNEIVVEIRGREPTVQNLGNVAYSHTTQRPRQPSASVAYRVTSFSGSNRTAPWLFTIRLTQPLTSEEEIRAITNGDPTGATPWARVGTQTTPAVRAAVVTMPLPQGGPLPNSEQQRYNRAILEPTSTGQPGYPTEAPVDLERCSMAGRNDFYNAYLDWKAGGVSPAQVKHNGPYCFKLTNANTILYTYSFNVTEVAPTGSPLDILNDAIAAIKNMPKAVAPPPPAVGPAAAPPNCDTLADEIEKVQQAATNLDQALTLLQPGKQGDKIASVSLATTLNAWTPIPAAFRDFESAVESLRQVLGGMGYNQSCTPIKAADDLILIRYRDARKAFLKLERLVNSSHVVGFPYEVDSSNRVKVEVDEYYNGQQTAAATKKYNLTAGYTAITSSAGFMVTNLPARSYSSVAAPNPADPSMTQTVLGVDYGRGTRLALTALLNYNLPFASQKDFGMALSIGPVFDISSGKADTSRFGLFGGVGLRLSKWMYVTPGVHIGEFADFPQGYTRAGQVLPTGQGTPPPVKRYTTRFAIAVTFKVKDLWTTPAPEK
jgi:hypothetical protein